MNLTRAFSFVFDNPDWWKIILTIGLLQFIPFVGQIAILGCTIVTARSLANGQERPLPRLDQIGDIFREGSLSFIISVFYYLPITIFSCFFFCLIGVIIASGSNREPPFGILIDLLICFSIMILPFTLSAYPEYPVAEEDSVGAQRRCDRTSIRFNPPYRETIIRIGSYHPTGMTHRYRAVCADRLVQCSLTARSSLAMVS